MIADEQFVEKGLDRILVESRIEDLEAAFEKLSTATNPELVILREEFAKLKEEISAGDWGRFGVIAGMLWYKLDSLISNLSTMNSTLRNIERNTSKIK